MDALLAPFLTEPVGMMVAFVLTLLVFSYLLGDNPLFRLAQALFVGVGVGYGIVVVFHYVLIPRLLLLTTNWLLVVPPLLLGLLLWFKLRPSWSWVGNVSVAFILAQARRWLSVAHYLAHWCRRCGPLCSPSTPLTTRT